MNDVSTTDAAMKAGQTIPLTIKSLGINGEGVGFFKRNVVFVADALPGEEVTARVRSAKRNFAEADLLKIRKPSPDRIVPPCPYYAQCGGCQLQHVDYARQLVEKRAMVEQALAKYAPHALEQAGVLPVIGMDPPWEYRNKSQFQLRQDGARIRAGLYAPGTNELIDIEACIVQHPKATAITRKAVAVLEELGIPAYSGKANAGVVRSLVVRIGFATGEAQLTLVTGQRDLPKKDALVRKLSAIDHSLVSIMQNVNSEQTPLVLGERTYLLAGRKAIRETLGSLSFDLSARAFFQLNPVQTVKLYDEIKRAAALSGTESLVDAYCGVGTIGLWLAGGAREIRGMDIGEDGIRNARQNAKAQGIETARYEVGTAEEWLAAWRADGFVPDVLTVDPPRTGLGASLARALLASRPQKIIYTSCNPSTLAKDLAVLKAAYRVASLQPIDMFPQTAQVECVVALHRIKSAR